MGGVFSHPPPSPFPADASRRVTVFGDHDSGKTTLTQHCLDLYDSADAADGLDRAPVRALIEQSNRSTIKRVMSRTQQRLLEEWMERQSAEAKQNAKRLDPNYLYRGDRHIPTPGWHWTESEVSNARESITLRTNDSGLKSCYEFLMSWTRWDTYLLSSDIDSAYIGYHDSTTLAGVGIGSAGSGGSGGSGGVKKWNVRGSDVDPVFKAARTAVIEPIRAQLAGVSYLPSVLVPIITEYLSCSFADIIDRIWRSEDVQRICRRRLRLGCSGTGSTGTGSGSSGGGGGEHSKVDPHSRYYFLDHILTISDLSYIPTRQDVFRRYSPHTGCGETLIKLCVPNQPGSSFWWRDCSTSNLAWQDLTFGDIAIYCVSLYGMFQRPVKRQYYTPELDRGTNRMSQALTLMELWQSAQTRWDRKGLILVLTKADLFDARIKSAAASTYPDPFAPPPPLPKHSPPNPTAAAASTGSGGAAPPPTPIPTDKLLAHIRDRFVRSAQGSGNWSAVDCVVMNCMDSSAVHSLFTLTVQRAFNTVWVMPRPKELDRLTPA